MLTCVNSRTYHHLSSPPMPHKSRWLLLYPCLMYFALWLCRPSSLNVHIYPRHLHDIFIDALCLSLAVISNSLQKWSQIAPNLTDCASQCINAYIWLYLIVFPSKQVSFATASASSKDCYLRQPWKKYWVTRHQRQLAVRPVRPTNTNRKW